MCHKMEKTSLDSIKFPEFGNSIESNNLKDSKKADSSENLNMQNPKKKPHKNQKNIANDIITINDDAIFIADSHTQENRDSLVLKLNNLSNIPSQIFLVGDISNMLIGGIKSSVATNKNLIDSLHTLSQKSQLIYFEGNHDFDLEPILPNIKKIPRISQPILANYKNNNILLAHGDLFLDAKYEIYIRILTSKKTISFLRILDIVSCGKIYAFIRKKVENKKIKLPYNADSIIKSRIQSYRNYLKSQNLSIDMIIEGHFHIGKIAKNKDFTYIALSSFYYDETAFNIKNNCFSVI
ncbi:hypothetical protein CCY99_03275 [Helicobacter sp. 16-1353]|uniref:UDP-2,3-diacylglucosamine diphosphatase n=1 Tax=Helicobacter sp. 16-1353 TaxID=2004996 RepID=UPI000DCCF10A|nr:metallophosphoesterase [Helicobacter sp. 16-1353]RAX54389.1 hypothetical protein CCY99_03275 [Helicobacter sp. 16-1353]